MSPNAYVAFNDQGLLVGYQGEHEGEEPVFVWTYSLFEEMIGEAITPSMYHCIAGYVASEISKEELYEVQGGDYCPGMLEACALDSYFDQPLNDRIEMHEQTLVNLRAAKRRAEAKESAAIDAMLEENKPFDDASPIAHEYADFMRGVIAKSRKLIDQIADEIHEEEQWRGGHEEGMEDDRGATSGYDPMDEY